MSVADRPVPRVFIFSPSDPEGRRNCADHPECVSERHHAEEGQ